MRIPSQTGVFRPQLQAANSTQVVTFAAKLMERLGKRPLILKKFISSFIVNRVQNVILANVLDPLDKSWVTPADIDFAVNTSLGIRLPIIGVLQIYDFTCLGMVLDGMKSFGGTYRVFEDKVKRGELGGKTSKGFYDYGGRSEEEILKKRDRLFLKMLDHLENTHAFEQV